MILQTLKSSSIHTWAANSRVSSHFQRFAMNNLVAALRENRVHVRLVNIAVTIARSTMISVLIVYDIVGETALLSSVDFCGPI